METPPPGGGDEPVSISGAEQEELAQLFLGLG